MRGNHGRPLQERLVEIRRSYELQQIKREACQRQVLDPEKLFSLSGAVLRCVQGVPGVDIHRRLSSYLNGKRRGRFRLPRWFPEPLHHLSNLSRAEIRQIAYWVKPSMSGHCIIPNYTAAYVHQVVPGAIWTPTRVAPGHGQSTVVRRLPRSKVPRVSRACWPSTPDIFEMLEMSRQGKVLPPRDKLGLVVPHHLTKRQLSDDIRLATQIVRQQIVGVRSSVTIPRKFLGSFRSYHDFLILTGRYKIPAGLVRFLLAQWVTHPSSLWLASNCHFKTFLKRHTRSNFIRSSGFPVHNVLTCLPVAKAGKPNGLCLKDSLRRIPQAILSTVLNGTRSPSALD